MNHRFAAGSPRPASPAAALLVSLAAASTTLAQDPAAITPDLQLSMASTRITLEPPETSGAAEPKIEPGAGADDSVELAKKLANPVASLISVPFQFNYDDGIGPRETGRLILNIQPVIPFSISEDWNLIVRTIFPLTWLGSVADGVDKQFGLGDTTQSFFFSPKEPVGGWILAVGPVALWPTGTDPDLRSEQLGLGPTALALRQDKGFTYGILANHIWGVTQSDDHAEVNQTFLQPFFSYSWPTATTLSINTESTYNWTAEEWTVPINLQIAQIVKFGHQPVQFFFGGRYYAESPDNGPEWGLRFGFTLLFPG